LVCHLEGKHRLRVFENRAITEYLELRGMKRREAGKNCIMQELRKLFSSPNIIKSDKGKEDEVTEQRQGRDE
jgi:hypothetical protein